MKKWLKLILLGALALILALVLVKVVTLLALGPRTATAATEARDGSREQAAQTHAELVEAVSADLGTARSTRPPAIGAA